MARTTLAASPSRRRRPARPGLRTGWTVWSTLFTVLLCVLFVEAYANSEFVPDHVRESGGQAQVPAGIRSGGPVIDTTEGRATSYRMSPRTIALTFDDGPDPVWTPKVLDLLRRHRAEATFFVVGSQVARHPGLTRRIATEGHELGVHSFSHPDLTVLPAWQRRLEYSQTQQAIVSTAGVRTNLLRFPYSSMPQAIDDKAWAAIREAGDLGYLTAVNDTDSRDWSRPGPEAMVRNMTPPPGQGAVVLLHDAGGDRSQTLAALDRFIPMMTARGYRFTTISDGVDRAMATDEEGAGPVAGNAPVSGLERWRGGSVVLAVTIADLFLAALRWLFLLVGLLMLARTLLLLVLAGRHARRRRSRRWPWGPPVTEPVSIIVPAYNEQAGIVATVRSLADGDHRGIEVIVVDDGSTDGTADLVEALGLPNVQVVRKPNGGKPSALNTGIAHARHEIIVMVDGDTVFERDSVRRLIEPFADPSVGAVAGNVKVANRTGLLGRWQHIEYVIGFNLDRRLYETLGCMPTVPGAIAAFRRRALLAAGGMSDDTLAEDTDITMAVLRAGWRVVYEERARAWTEAPSSLGQLWRQRYRWSYGTMQAMWKHRRAVFDRGASGRFGRFGLPVLALFGVVLPLLGPVLDLMALYGLVFLGATETAVAWVAMLAVQALTALVAFRLDRERIAPLWSLPVQQFAYRQLMYLVLVRSTVTALTGTRLRWRKLKRAGDPAVGAPRDPVAAGGGRDRWFDLLRSVALARVIVYHMFGFAWMSWAFPAMGVMFALGGSLMARSLDRSPTGAVNDRLRRLLPALWVMGAVVVPVMIWHGWSDRPAWPALLTWVFPLAEPPGSDWARDVTGVLWYLVAFLWLVLLSPVLLGFYRRWPLPTALLPLAVVVILQTATPSLGRAVVDSVAIDLATFGACWIAGFAHRDGHLRRIPWAAVVALAGVCAAGAVGWVWTHPEAGFDLNEIPVAQAFYSLGFALVLLRMAPRLAWLRRVRPLDGLVTTLNSRALTVYLWHNAAIAVCFVVGNQVDAWEFGKIGYLAVALAILAVVVVLLGWVEDVSAKRRPTLAPWRTRATPTPGRPLPARVPEPAPPPRRRTTVGR
ncbi:glycosyltransferase [Micromonospora thermarum]|uniref:Glycosyltransferase n=1 Tax=Micromonospora thermarum TaxID=2720024 RepID=A0ABX0ZA96_9ACTN|nr:glycosyltransferase [Micromonospora thermarum]NJP32825.1 glycosyltransferase [Micromonospora thermarum]